MSTMVLTRDMLVDFGWHLQLNEKSPHTIEKYFRDAAAFWQFASGRPLTKDLVVDYKKYLTGSGKYADSSINSMLASLRGLFKFLKREDCAVTSIRTQEMPYCPENRSLTMEEYQRLLAAAGGDDRLQMILKVLVGTGIRISELKYFTVEALKKKRRHASIRVSCKKKSREIIIPDGLREELFHYIRKKGLTEGVIFCTRSGKPVDRSNFWRQMKSLCRKARVDEEKVFPHNVRKLFARTFYEKSHDIAQLACLLGHSSINTTAIYVKRTEREVRAKVDCMIKEILHENGCRKVRISCEPDMAGRKVDRREPDGRERNDKKPHGQRPEKFCAHSHNTGRGPKEFCAHGQDTGSRAKEFCAHGQDTGSRPEKFCAHGQGTGSRSKEFCTHRQNMGSGRKKYTTLSV